MRHLRTEMRHLRTESQEPDEIGDLVRDLRSWSDRDARLIAEGGALWGGRREGEGLRAEVGGRVIQGDVLAVIGIWILVVGMLLGLWIADGGKV